jgi:hypothetical protein
MSMTTAATGSHNIALTWSARAMQDATERVNKISGFEPDRAFAAIGEALWWTTIVDDELQRHHVDGYNAATKSFKGGNPPYPADILLGLRSVRNRLGHEVEPYDIIRPISERVDPGDGRITAWQWQHIPPPSADGRTRGQRDYDLRAHDAYERAVVDGGQGGNIVFTFTVTNSFLATAYALA